jgi:hypothetical protein
MSVDGFAQVVLKSEKVVEDALGTEFMNAILLRASKLSS